jgi:hypothetical protein
MYAVFSTTYVESPEQSRRALPSERLDLVRRVPGFIAAYWLEAIEGRGASIVLFESKAHAEAAAAYPIPPMEGVAVLSVEVREVYASA